MRQLVRIVPSNPRAHGFCSDLLGFFDTKSSRLRPGECESSDPGARRVSQPGYLFDAGASVPGRNVRRKRVGRRRPSQNRVRSTRTRCRHEIARATEIRSAQHRLAVDKGRRRQNFSGAGPSPFSHSSSSSFGSRGGIVLAASASQAEALSGMCAVILAPWSALPGLWWRRRARAACSCPTTKAQAPLRCGASPNHC
jgi:hypothetical protein